MLRCPDDTYVYQIQTQRDISRTIDMHQKQNYDADLNQFGDSKTASTGKWKNK